MAGKEFDIIKNKLIFFILVLIASSCASYSDITCYNIWADRKYKKLDFFITSHIRPYIKSRWIPPNIFVNKAKNECDLIVTLGSYLHQIDSVNVNSIQLLCNDTIIFDNKSKSYLIERSQNTFQITYKSLDLNGMVVCSDTIYLIMNVETIGVKKDTLIKKMFYEKEIDKGWTYFGNY